jgi:hypothetical protein
MTEKYGIIASFPDTPSFFHAAEKVRDAGYKKWDTYSSFPVHGMPEAQGQPRSKVPIFTFLGGITGFTVGLVMVWWMNAYDYPLIVRGQPFFSPVFPFPIMFITNLLPQHYSPLFNSDQFLEVSGDRLVIAIEARDAQYDVDATRQFLEEIGGTDIEEVSA